VLAGAGLAKSSQTCAQMTNVQQPAASPSQTGQGMGSQDVELLRKDIRAKKKQMIAANLKLTEAEATKFWPIYDQYTQELIGINDKRYDLIKQYSQNWGSITDDQAMIWQAKLVGPGYSNYAVALQVRPDRARGAAGQKGRHFFSTGSPHQHDDRSADFLAAAAGSKPGVVLLGISVIGKAPRNLVRGAFYLPAVVATYKLHKAVNGSMMARSRQSEVAFAVRNQDGP
jgi:hypothetical protein